MLFASCFLGIVGFKIENVRDYIKNNLPAVSDLEKTDVTCLSCFWLYVL
jgi:hypothetical protein